MEHVELIVFGLLVAIAGLAVLARVVRVPYPVTLVLGGALIGFLPGVPDVQLDPDLVLLIFLPPLLYGAAFFTSVRDLRRNAKAIAMLSIPLVVVTMGAVAVVAHEVVGLDWGPAFVLGAIVSPTDAVAPGRDHAPDRRAAAPDLDRRGREPHERLDRAGPVPVRGGRRGERARSPSGRRSRSSSPPGSAACWWDWPPGG